MPWAFLLAGERFDRPFSIPAGDGADGRTFTAVHRRQQNHGTGRRIRRHLPLHPPPNPGAGPRLSAKITGENDLNHVLLRIIGEFRTITLRRKW